jgi:hypothetical protein
MFVTFKSYALDSNDMAFPIRVAPMSVESFEPAAGYKATAITMQSGSIVYVSETHDEVEKAFRDYTGVDVEPGNLPSDAGPATVRDTAERSAVSVERNTLVNKPEVGFGLGR